jgi:serine/threonine protein kinase
LTLAAENGHPNATAARHNLDCSKKCIVSGESRAVKLRSKIANGETTEFDDDADDNADGMLPAVVIVVGVAVLVLVAVNMLVLCRRRRARILRAASCPTEVDVARRTITATKSELVASAAHFLRLRSPDAASAEQPPSAALLATARMASKFVAVARDRAEARFIIGYRQLVEAKSMVEFKAELCGLEVLRATVSLGGLLGRGQSGIVFSGECAGAAGCVAVKMRIGAADAAMGTKAVEADEALLLEALLLSGLRHPGIIELLAVVSHTAPVLICTELMANGDLRRFLLANRAHSRSRSDPPACLECDSSEAVTPQVMLGMAATLSSAMAFLEQRSIIHRDVAARNVLVGDTATAVKLADLGAARSVHRSLETSYNGVYIAHTDHNPARWMPLEALREAKFSHKSDVFAFGVLLWEILSLGSTPWGAFEVKDFSAALDRGDRLAFPSTLEEELNAAESGAAKKIYSIADRCWRANPAKRPTFDQLEAELSTHQKVLRSITAAVFLPTDVDGLETTNNAMGSKQPKSDQRFDTIAAREQPKLDAEGYVEDVQASSRPVFDGAMHLKEIAVRPTLDADGYVDGRIANARTSFDSNGHVADAVAVAQSVIGSAGRERKPSLFLGFEQDATFSSSTGFHSGETRL